MIAHRATKSEKNINTYSILKIMLYTKRTFDCEFAVSKADVCLLGIPFDSAEIGRPVKYGPIFIRESIKNLIGYDPELKVNIFNRYKFSDIGDIDVVPSNWKLTEERIVDTFNWMFAENKNIFPVSLGGDHLITLGILNAIKKNAKEKITVVDFDAHLDLKEDWMGERFSHVSWASHILNDNSFNLIQIGCRIGDAEEFNKKVRSTLHGLKGLIYITIDLDVLDPSFAPDVGTPESGGISPKELLYFLSQVCKQRVIGMDIVECASDRLHTTTSLVAAQIFKKVLGWRLKYEKG